MAAKQLIEPRTLKGFNDVLPEQAALRRAVIRTVEEVFELYGFAPLETPALEYLDTLLGTGGEETNKEMFRLESPEGDPIALRFDHTVPFARVLAQYPDLLKAPFRRYAVGPNWRADKPGQWRLRQFTQVDIDVAGPDSVAVDAEVLSAITTVMQRLNARGFVIQVNNRKLIDALLDGCGIHDPARAKHVLRVIDKLEKVGLDAVQRELGEGRIDDSGDPIPGVQLEADVIDRLLAFIAISGATRGEVVDHVAAALPASDLTDKAVAEMRDLDACLTALGVGEAQVVFSPSLARGLDYYTGPVFEIALPDAPAIGSFGGGGRYDGLVDRFLNRRIPCTGFAFGLERLLGALEAVDALPETPPRTEVLVVTMGRVPLAETLRLASELRAAGLRTEPYVASRKKMGMGNQLSHADHYGVPVAVILGEDELANGVVSIKDLMEGKRRREDITDREAYRAAGKEGQVSVARTEMVSTVLGMLGRA